jgi:pimeloyl-ACP methyl ester carboxylesterase
MNLVYKSADGERAVQERYRKFLAYWPVPNEQVRVSTREGETFVVVSGPAAAPPLLLLHGSAVNSTMWMGDITAWAQHFRVYAVDLIGEPGLSAPSRPPLSSDAHALWLDEVMHGLSLTHTSIVGASLGGFLALDYAIRRPGRVDSVAVLCPGGVGRQKIGFLIKVFPLLLMGGWGRRKAGELILGRMPENVSPAVRKYTEFIRLIQENFRPRRAKLPLFSDDSLHQLNMPVMAILGGKDVLFDNANARDRLARSVPHAKICYLPEAGHLLPGHTATIFNFLSDVGRIGNLQPTGNRLGAVTQRQPG